jgi:hypothetical protein
VVAGFFASSNEMIDLKSLENMNLDSILDALPASFVSSAQQLQVSRPTKTCQIYEHRKMDWMLRPALIPFTQ